MRPKPRLLVDIRRKGRVDVFATHSDRINLGRKSSKKKKKKALWLRPAFLIFALILLLSANSSVFAPIGGGVRALTVEQEREQLQDQLQEYEKQIKEYKQTIGVYQQKGATLKDEINRLNAKISGIEGKIGQINTTLSKLTGEIRNTSSRITDTQGRIDRSKEALSGILRRVNKDDEKGLIDILLENPNLSDFFIDVNDLFVLQDNLKVALDDLALLKDDLITQRELLALEKSDIEVLKLYQVQQKSEVQDVKAEQDHLLTVTKGQEAGYQVLLAKAEKSAAEIRAQIFRLLGGGQMTFEEAYNFAKYAQQRTGVRAALIMAVLDRESALGRNVGQCNYRTAMHPERDIPHFLAITKELGLDPDNTLVSCPIVADGAYGGAMGPAQFIPSTWSAYKSRVAAVTGSNPASPWRNLDAFVASGLYLKDSGASSNELAAAAKYYCGGNWQRSVCVNVYGAAVISRAEEIQRDINILER